MVLYIARYSISWEEVTVDKNGQSVVRSRSWEGMGVIRPQALSSISQLSLICAIFELRLRKELVFFGIDGKQSMIIDQFLHKPIEKSLTGEQH